jgi:uncharacterized integral membrane protein
MANNILSREKFSKAWIVLAVILILFFIALFIDQMVATVVPTYTGVFTELPGILTPGE